MFGYGTNDGFGQAEFRKRHDNSIEEYRPVAYQEAPVAGKRIRGDWSGIGSLTAAFDWRMCCVAAEYNNGALQASISGGFSACYESARHKICG
jgi:hypothetical protein